MSPGLGCRRPLLKPHPWGWLRKVDYGVQAAASAQADWAQNWLILACCRPQLGVRPGPAVLRAAVKPGDPWVSVEWVNPAGR